MEKSRQQASGAEAVKIWLISNRVNLQLEKVRNVEECVGCCVHSVVGATTPQRKLQDSPGYTWLLRRPVLAEHCQSLSRFPAPVEPGHRLGSDSEVEKPPQTNDLQEYEGVSATDSYLIFVQGRGAHSGKPASHRTVNKWRKAEVEYKSVKRWCCW